MDRQTTITTLKGLEVLYTLSSCHNHAETCRLARLLLSNILGTFNGIRGDWSYHTFEHWIMKGHPSWATYTAVEQTPAYFRDITPHDACNGLQNACKLLYNLITDHVGGTL